MRRTRISPTPRNLAQGLTPGHRSLARGLNPGTRNLAPGLNPGTRSLAPGPSPGPRSLAPGPNPGLRSRPLPAYPANILRSSWLRIAAYTPHKASRPASTPAAVGMSTAI